MTSLSKSEHKKLRTKAILYVDYEAINDDMIYGRTQSTFQFLALDAWEIQNVSEHHKEIGLIVGLSSNLGQPQEPMH